MLSLLWLVVRFLWSNIHWVAVIFGPYLIATTISTNPPSDNSNANDNQTPTADRDDDGIPDADDNCASAVNPQQEDADADGFGDLCDNCPQQPNPDQADADGDGLGDVCAQPGGSVSGRIVPIEAVTALSVQRNGRRVPAFSGAAAPHQPDELLVVYEKGLSTAKRRSIQQSRSLTLISSSPSGIHRYRCPAPACADTPQKRYLSLLHEARRLQEQPGVLFAEPNYRRHPQIIPADEQYASQEWHFDAINLPDAWDTSTGSANVILALVDTGTLLDHPDLAGKLVDGFDFISSTTTANDGDGIDDDPDDPGDSTVGGSTFHGTHVAGTLGAATDNDLGVAGICWDCSVMPVRALGVGGGSVADIVEGVRFAGGLSNISGRVPQQSARVVNLSLGGVAGEPESDIERAAIQELVAAGVTVVAAAGNEGSSLPAPPASYPETISVGAVDALLRRAGYSNFGETLDIMAPGGRLSRDDNNDGIQDGIFSTKGSDRDGAIEFTYDFQEGTSMACPHVSGVIGLLLSIDPTLTPEEIRLILLGTAQDLGAPARDDQFGYGLLDARAAAQAAEDGEIPELPDDGEGPTDPILTLSTNDVDFGLVGNSQDVAVTNSGDGVLDVTSVTDFEDDRGAWLSTTTSGTNDTTTVTTITITVNREGLEPGVYTGTILVQALDVVPVAISVRMEIPQITFVGTILVEAVVADSGQVMARTSTSDAEDFVYTFANLPAGTYMITAGTDNDGDQMICEEDDLCGSFSDPVTVAQDESAEDIDILVSPGQ